MNIYLSKNRSLVRRGFTLLETLIVISIIAVLAALVVGGIDLIRDKTNNNRTKVLVDGLSNALESYKLENNEYPDGDGSITSSNELYKALYGDYDLNDESDEGETVYFHKLDPNLKGNKRNVDKDNGHIIIDSWENPIYYQSPGKMNPSGDFDLWSLGPDELGGPNGNPDHMRDDLDNF